MATKLINDDELVRAAQQGKLDAFTALYERHVQTVYRRVRYIIPEPDIEDVVQEIFIAVMRSLKSFRYESMFSTWLRTVTNRQVADYYRRNAAQRMQVDLAVGQDDIESDQPGRLSIHLTAHPNDLDDAVTLKLALAELPEAYREILLSRFADGLQFNEIAAQNGKSLDATKSLFRRAVAELKKQVELTHE